MKRFLMLAVMLGLSGCSTWDAPANFSFSADGHHGEGLLVGSVTSDDPGQYFSRTIRIYFDPLAEDSRASQVELSVNDQCSPGASHYDFVKPCGKLFAVALPAGDYTLQKWYTVASIGTKTVYPQRWDGASVTVQAGKITYVGDIHMVFDDAIPGGAPAGSRSWPRATDMHERDLPLLFQKYPNLKPEDVVMQVLELPPPGRVCVVKQPAMQFSPEVTDCGGP